MDALKPASGAASPGMPFVTPLKRIANPKGDLLHALKCSDAGYAGFGEAYFTTVHQGVRKGWKQHTRMQMNLVVPVGRVRFHLRDEARGTTTHHDLGEDAYARLTVPPGQWMAFEGLGAGLNLVLNLASIEHDPGEAMNRPLEDWPLDAAA
jgi:dTDP-4-dehydrorhamnose 3,5-epimerase